MLLCGVMKSCVMGLYFFEESGWTITVNSQHYLLMLKIFLIPELQRNGVVRRRLWFQQDGTTAHTVNKMMDYLRSTIRCRGILHFGDIAWPARSPDVSICDFFLWGFLKARVYTNKPCTLDELKEIINQEIVNLSPAILEKVFNSFSARLEESLVKEGFHLKDSIFKS